MRVLHVVASINREIGGPAVSVSCLAESLSRLGVQSGIATLDYARHGPRAAPEGVRVESLEAGALARMFRGWSPGFARMTAAAAQAHADVVHSHGMWMFPNYYARRAAVAHKIPLVISPRGMLDEWSLRRSRARKALVWRLMERGNFAQARLLHATSAAEANAIRAARLEQPIAVIANGVDLPRGDAPGRALLEAEFPALLGKRWLLFMSRLHPKKGLAELLRAWRAIEVRFPGWQLVIAGPDLDGHGEAMRALAQELRLADRVTFTNMLSGDAKSCALRHADIFVLPTHAENFGLVVAEALAHGTPVVTTQAAPWRELREERCGWWIEEGDAALRQALAQAMDLPAAERDEMGTRGRALIAARYSWDRAGRDMLAAYRWIRGLGPRPPVIQ